MRPTSPRMIFKSNFFSSAVFCHFSSPLIKFSSEKSPWDKVDKTPTFTGTPPPDVTILTMLEAIRTSQDVMGDNVSVNIVAEWRKRGIFHGFIGEMM